MKYLLSTMVPLLAILFAAGCGDPKVTGKVTFPDGTPLTQGQVMFQKEGFIGSGTIQQDGTYSAGKLKDGDGLPPGQYEVFLTGTSAYDYSEVEQLPPGSEIGGRPAFRTPTPIELIDYRYMAPNTSELTVDVQGKTTFDITVEPPLR